MINIGIDNHLVHNSKKINIELPLTLNIALKKMGLLNAFLIIHVLFSLINSIDEPMTPCPSAVEYVTPVFAKNYQV